jgi:hypothetical protein
MNAGPNVDSIFCAAVEFESAHEREAYLDQACMHDPQVRERVEKLLQAHSKAGIFLQQPAPGSGRPRQRHWSLQTASMIYVLEYLNANGEKHEDWVPRVRKVSRDG